MLSFLQISLGLVYLIALIFLFIWINKGNTKIPAYWIASAFIAKVVGAFVYGYIYANFLPVSDSWILFEESLKEYNNLLHQPAAFFKTGFSYHTLPDLFSNKDDAFWNNTDDNLFIKIVGLLNVFTGGNYYLTALLFSFFSFWGLYRILATTIEYYPANTAFIFILIFFTPSNLFWNSGLHKDGLIVFFTGMTIMAADKLIRNSKSRVWFPVLFLSLFLLFLFRTLNTMLLMPALIAWIWTSQYTGKTILKFLLVYAVTIFGFFLTIYLPDAYNLPLKLAEKQHNFLLIEASSALPLSPLEPNFLGYLKVLPRALNHVFLRPYISEINGPLQLMAFIEGTAMTILVAWLFIGYRRSLRNIPNSPVLLFLLFFSLSNLVVIGLTVPFTGGIVRYKALYTVLLLTAILLPISRTNSNIKIY